MLDLRFKSICLVSSFLGYKEGVKIVEWYYKRSLYLMLLKWYHYLHPMVKFEIGCAYQTIDANSNLDIF
jgi:hypothetical protein